MGLELLALFGLDICVIMAVARSEDGHLRPGFWVILRKPEDYHGDSPTFSWHDFRVDRGTFRGHYPAVKWSPLKTRSEQKSVTASRLASKMDDGISYPTRDV
jgi:hypothetical protein